jgi:hypothetical protein
VVRHFNDLVNENNLNANIFFFLGGGHKLLQKDKFCKLYAVLVPGGLYKQTTTNFGVGIIIFVKYPNDFAYFILIFVTSLFKYIEEVIK